MRGLSVATKDLISFALKLLTEDHPQTLRQLHYGIFSRTEIDYQNDLASYKRLSRATTLARREYRAWELRGWGTRPAYSIPDEWIVDEQRKPEMVSVWQNASAYVDTVRRSYRRDNWQTQPNYVELWGEKATVLGSMRPISEEWGITLRVCRGFGSAGMESAVGRLFEGIGKPITVLYVGDHDASGHVIQQDMHRRVELAGAVNFNMVRLAVHAEDIQRFNLPPQHIKEADTRAAAFRREFGADAATVELEALPAAELRRRVAEAIRGFIDFDLWDREVQVQEVELNCIRDFAARMKNLPQIGGTA